LVRVGSPLRIAAIEVGLALGGGRAGLVIADLITQVSLRQRQLLVVNTDQQGIVHDLEGGEEFNVACQLLHEGDLGL